MGSTINNQEKMGHQNKVTVNKNNASNTQSAEEPKISVNKVNIVAELSEKKEEIIELGGNTDVRVKNKHLKHFIDTVKKGFLKETLIEERAKEENNSKKTMQDKYNYLVPLKYEKTILLSNAVQLNALLTRLFIPLVNILRKQNLKQNLFNFTKIILLSHIIIKEVNTSRLYHVIKLQSYMKIFALINFLQLIEKLTSTILVDLTATTNNSNFYLLLQLPVLFMNSLVIIMQALTYNVIINSRNNKNLNILLLTISFNKLKSTTFKKFNGSSLFQIILQDSNDRFQLNLSLIIVCLKNYYYFGKILQLILVTMLTDWLHQLFIVRYNNIEINAFSAFQEVIIEDYETRNVIYRLGMPVDGHIISCIVLLYRRKIGFGNWVGFIACFIVLKVILLFALEKISDNNKKKKSLSSLKPIRIDAEVTRFVKGSFKENNNQNNGRSLSEIVRYEMNGKKIF